jgi:hypothetical protein
MRLQHLSAHGPRYDAALVLVLVRAIWQRVVVKNGKLVRRAAPRMRWSHVEERQERSHGAPTLWPSGDEAARDRGRGRCPLMLGERGRRIPLDQRRAVGASTRT